MSVSTPGGGRGGGIMVRRGGVKLNTSFDFRLQRKRQLFFSVGFSVLCLVNLVNNFIFDGIGRQICQLDKPKMTVLFSCCGRPIKLGLGHLLPFAWGYLDGSLSSRWCSISQCGTHTVVFDLHIFNGRILCLVPNSPIRYGMGWGIFVFFANSS